MKTKIESGGRLTRGQNRQLIEEMLESVPPKRALWLRAYNVKTGEVEASAQVDGNTDSELLHLAVKDLVKQVYKSE